MVLWGNSWWLGSLGCSPSQVPPGGHFLGGCTSKGSYGNPLGHRSCRTKVLRIFQISARILSRILLRIFPEFFEEFSCFASWETKTSSRAIESKYSDLQYLTELGCQTVITHCHHGCRGPRGFQYEKMNLPLVKPPLTASVSIRSQTCMS